MNRFTIPLFIILFFSKSLAAQVDTVPPVLVCKNIPDITVYGICAGALWVSDFVDTVYDDISTAQNIQLGIRKQCTGSGFPENSTSLNASVYETLRLEIWAKDANGNTSSCQINTYVGDISGACDPGYSFLAHLPINDANDNGIAHVDFHVTGANCTADSVDIQINSGNEAFYSQFGILIPTAGYNTIVTANKNINPLNGVSTYDLVLISKHILGIEPFDSPWKFIAADANQDGQVSTYDIVILRKLILGITNELPNGKSWRFLPQNYSFPDPANPFQPPFPERIEVPNTADPPPSFFPFKGVKIGDVDFSADPKQ